MGKRIKGTDSRQAASRVRKRIERGGELLGRDTVVHTRRPEAWISLAEIEAALLDFMRRGGKTTELSPEETVRRLVNLFRHAHRFERILKVAKTEPPRVRAILGAIGEEI